MFSSRAALMSLIIASTFSGQALANESVSFAMNSWIGYAPLFVASAKGYFGDYNIKYIHMEQGINAALLSRDVDMADLSMNQVIMDNIKGSKIKVFMPIDYSNGADQIISKTSIKNIKDLKGLTIPLDIGSYSELLLAYALQQNGLSIRDIKMKDVPASDVPSVLLGNRAKVGVTWAPHTEVILSHPGYKT
ncbi:ABC transporter substrate-binding protein, partial [Acidithiobacillus ferriphilus]|uniref:ABC transporter substrate-binding protein n=1 Tax=Acidithiobacillus ferriphilus TaxID=1689834 RepID=UPI001C07E899